MSIKFKEINFILKDIGFENRFNTEQTAVCIYVLHSLKKRLRIHDIITGARKLLSKKYAENTRESIRKLSLKRLVLAGLVVPNEDDPSRPINSGLNNYMLEGKFRAILDVNATKRKDLIEKWKTKHKGCIIDSVRDEIKKHEIPIILEGKKLILSSGEHNLLIKQIIEVFIPSHFPDFEILYVGDTKNKEFYLNKELSKKVSYTFNIHDKLPDVMAYSFKSKRLLVIESVTSVGPVEESRKEEIKKLIKKTMPNVSQIKEIIYVTSFLDASAYGKFSKIIAYGTYVWIANRPKNLISYS